MNEKQLFANVLDADEQIVETFKPNKTRFIGLGIISDILKGIIPVIFGIVWIVITSLGEMTNEAGEPVTDAEMFIPRLIGYGIVGLSILGVLIGILVRLVRYNKTAYCYTNKRIIIRTGVIGADYQTLDFDLIGAMNVRVDLLDKIIKPNTGTIWFASAASPMMMQVNGPHVPGGMSGFCFAHIEQPYEVYKRVKEYSSQNKDGKTNS